MMRRLAIIALALVFLIGGCLKPITKTGCCLKENISQGCVLYNTTDFTTQNMIPFTLGDCDDNDTNTTGHCNVSIGGTGKLIPICTQDQLQPCIEPECTAMVCGDFKFQPKIAPSFQGTEESKGDVPASEEEGSAANFYKAQCRFLPMDADLSSIMKNSNSLINVFRVGVGGSFDEYEQYKYFFPVSDRYCGVSSAFDFGKKKVDRYINYLQSDGSYFDPVSGITENCVDGTDDPLMISFDENSSTKMSLFGISVFSYSPAIPDTNNYKFAHYARIDYGATVIDPYLAHYKYDSYVNKQFSIHKKIDKEYYKKQLSIASADLIYGLNSSGSTRAGFECDISGGDCWSGLCDSQFYNRGVNVKVPGGIDGQDVVTDCNKITDELGKTKVVCSPLMSVTTNGTGTPKLNYAKMTLRPVRLVTFAAFRGPDYNAIRKDIQDDNYEWLKESWDTRFDNIFTQQHVKAQRTRTYVPSEVTFYRTQRKNCCHDYSDCDEEGKENDQVLCSSVGPGNVLPPAASIEFFGKVGDEDEVKYGGETIIGYAIVDDDDFDDMMFVKNCGITPADYVKVDINTNFHHSALIDAFEPYYLDRADSLMETSFDDGCGKEMQFEDLVLSSMPWVISYDKGIYFQPGDEYYYFDSILASSTAQYLQERNVYNQQTLNMTGTSSCDMRKTALPWSPFYDDKHYYNVAYSRYIYLFKYDSSKKAIGNCAVDESTLLPEIRTYGWCEPCTTSTLAFQEIKAKEGVYMPAYSARIEDPIATSVSSICTMKYGWQHYESGGGYFLYEGMATCENPYITDVSDYSGNLAEIGSPRTEPEATVIKERMGNFMKSGAMPVLDMSDDSNWNISSPYLAYFGIPYQQYDFEALFGEMGASVVIVDHVNGTASDAQLERIINRSGIVRDNCFGCIAAVHVDSPKNTYEFNQSLYSFLSDPTAAANIELVTFDYPIFEPNERALALVFAPILSGEGTPGEFASRDIANMGRASLQGYGIPTMVVGLNIQNVDGWDSDTYELFFTDIIRNQDELVKAGVIGIIYQPVRTSTTSGKGSEGIVKTSGGVGTKGEKFCAFQQAMQTMSLSPPVSVFTKTVSSGNVSCVPCTSLEIAQQKCGSDALQCDNGAMCTFPGAEGPGLTAGENYTCTYDGSYSFMCPDGGGDCILIGEDDLCSTLGSGGSSYGIIKYKCPEGYVVDPCKLCNETSGTYTCTLSYTDGTVSTINGSMSELGSDLYLDVIAGIPKPDRCCLSDSRSNTTYTFRKDSYPSSISAPIVFPKSGDNNTDCGLGNSKAVSELSTFCGLPYSPLSDYDINCTVSG